MIRKTIHFPFILKAAHHADFRCTAAEMSRRVAAFAIIWRIFMTAYARAVHLGRSGHAAPVRRDSMAWTAWRRMPPDVEPRSQASSARPWYGQAFHPCMTILPIRPWCRSSIMLQFGIGGAVLKSCGTGGGSPGYKASSPTFDNLYYVKNARYRSTTIPS